MSKYQQVSGLAPGIYKRQYVTVFFGILFVVLISGFWLQKTQTPVSETVMVNMSNPSVASPNTQPLEASFSKADSHQHTSSIEHDLPAVNPVLGARIRELESRSPADATIYPQPDGSVVADLRGHFRSTVVAAIDEQGKVHISHGGNFPVAGDKDKEEYSDEK